MIRSILFFLLSLTISVAHADSIPEQISIAHRFGLEMHEFIDGCLIEMKVYHDISHADCKAFIKAGNIFNAARDKIVEHLYATGTIDKGAPAVEQIGAMGSLAKGEPAYGILAGWQAMDRFLDRVQLLD